MKGFVIFGYYGRGNLGDETNLRELVSLIRRVNPESDITVISATPGQTAHHLPARAVGKYSVIDICFAIFNADVLIGGGGSLFQDRTSLRSLIYYSTLVLVAKIFKVRILMYGQGIGPLHSPISRMITGLILSMADLITVRDRLSIISLAELNVRKPEIFITAEPLLSLNELPEEMIKSYWRSYPTEKRLRVGLIIQEHGFMQKKFWTQLVECIGWDQNVELYLIPIDPKDLNFLQDLSSSANITLIPLGQE